MAAPAAPRSRSGDDLVSVITADHEEIKALFAEVRSATDTAARQDAFARLVRKLAVHETAEEEVVRPTVRAAGGDAEADSRNQEEDKAKQVLSDLEKMGPGDPGFLAKLASFQADVVAHAEREEREEHPLLQREDQDRLRRLAGAFRAAESAAPTHPHPHGPESAAGNMILGPAVAVADRARDAVRSAMAKIGR